MWYIILGVVCFALLIFVTILIDYSLKQNSKAEKLEQELVEKEKLENEVIALMSQFKGERAQKELLERMLKQQDKKLEEKLKNKEKQTKKRLDVQRVVLKGKIAERLVKLAKNLPYNPSDLFPQAPPLDWLILDGYSEDKDEFTVIFAEIKTGEAKMNANERKIKKAVQAGRVEYKVLRAEAHVEVKED